MIRVLAAVIRREDRYLVCRRPAHKRHGGLWEFPGGKLEPGESDLDAARRELREELDVTAIRVGTRRHVHVDDAFTIEFLDVEIDREPRALEHDEIRWATVTELRTLDLAPADREFAATLP